MVYCKNCGAQMDDSSNFCPSCGASQTENTNQPQNQGNIPYYAPPAGPSGSLNIGMLVWAIINLIACCTPLGIAGLIFTVLAPNAPTAEEEAKKLKTAKLCNLIGTIAGCIFIIGYIIFYVFVIVMAGNAVK